MNVPLRRDSENGLTIAQFDGMPATINKRIVKMKQSTDPQDLLDAASLEADIPVWEAASKQLKGKDGGYREEFADISGLSKTRPALAAAFAIFMFSLAGIPIPENRT